MLRVLGPLQAEINGRAADLGTSRQRAVIARLVAAGGHVVSTDRFIEDLWRGQPPPKALAALQVYVSNLRRALEPGRVPRTPATVLVSAAPGYRLRLEPELVDAWLFPVLAGSAADALAEGDGERALGLAERALGLWQGPAYAEFADEEWAEPEAARLEELRLVAVEHRAEALLALGRNAEVELEPHVRAHPLRENAVRLLALARYRAGRQADALAAIRRARTVLAEELGVDPGPGLRTLEADILAHAESLHREPPARLRVSPAAGEGPPEGLPPLDGARPPGEERDRAGGPGRDGGHARGSERADGLVGRTAELAVLHEIAASPGLHTVWLGGEAGAGKSTLAEAFAAGLAAEGRLTATGRCPETDGGAPPAWAWSEVLRALAAVRPPGDGLAVRLAPLLTDDAPPAGQFHLARAVEEYLAGAARDGARPLVVLEDVHRADGETLQLLRHLVVRLAGLGITVLATYRPAEAGDHLGATWAALAGRNTHRIDLGGLGGDDVARLLRERSGVEVDAATARTVAERTGGNPLFVSETARLIGAEGASAARTLPPGVRDLIRRRVSRLPATARTALRDAAIVGRDVDVDVLLAMEGADEDTVLEGLEAGVLTGLLTEPAPGRVRFAHVLVRETLYEDTPGIRRTRLHGRVLDALERVRPGDVSALGHHALAAATPGTAGRALPYVTAAASAAAGLYAYREAGALYRGALGLTDDDRTRFDLLCGLVRVQAQEGNVMAARENRERAIAVARRLGAGAARAITSFEAPVTWSIQPDGQRDEALVAMIEEALETAEGEERCRLLAMLVFEIEGTDDARADAAASEALDLARGLGRTELTCLALNARYFAVLSPHRRDELEAVGRELVELGGSAGPPGYAMQGHHALFMVSLGRNDLAAARHHADLAIERATDGQLGPALGVLSLLDTLLLVLKGEFEQAERSYAAAAERMHQAGVMNALGLIPVGLLFVRLASGRGERSLPDMAAYAAHVPPEQISEMHVRALVAAGRLREARDAWRPGLEGPRDAFWVVRLALRAENAIGLRDAAVAERCHRELVPWEDELAGFQTGSVVYRPVAHILGDLAEFLGRDGSVHYARAVRTAELVGAPHWAREAAEALERARTRTGR
ncbi:BTAD domain-containing putative transcriptional regulator [Planomonospora venezuelensis]|uniref:DNA-binding SARP family transcriptional activator n=1 Tax=Planomonospora venezuelensis TaxID=1999 RepID=A0A841CYY2_PLAVE|nr:BTAD domain-containing putative transcriptional regulator [Planomonospora venezuelensis]MBB5961318.1 DNA-binding SARP family transcriptional activator [Planomonospora venezuelensis]GIN01940.1 hypothetical protein Pve01_35980 [Planomonospora venezuelensis]